jgi:hypothetical protein
MEAKQELEQRGRSESPPAGYLLPVYRRDEVCPGQSFHQDAKIDSRRRSLVSFRQVVLDLLQSQSPHHKANRIGASTVREDARGPTPSDYLDLATTFFVKENLAETNIGGLRWHCLPQIACIANEPHRDSAHNANF